MKKYKYLYETLLEDIEREIEFGHEHTKDNWEKIYKIGQRSSAEKLIEATKTREKIYLKTILKDNK